MTVLKKLAKKGFQQLGYELRKISSVNNSRFASKNLVDLDVGLFNHCSDIDILKYSINDNQTNRFLKKINDGTYKLIDVPSPLCPYPPRPSHSQTQNFYKAF